MSKTLESDAQKAFIKWVRHHEEDVPALRTIYHPANSYFRVSWGIIQWLKQLGVRSGVWDIHMPVDNGAYSSLWIEFKSPKGKLSKEQIAFRDNVYASSVKSPYFTVCTSAEEAIAVVKAFLRTGENL